MDWSELFKNILFWVVPHNAWQYALFIFASHEGIKLLVEKVIKQFKSPISEIEKYKPFLEILGEELKDPPSNNPVETKRFDDPNWIFYLPNLIKKIFKEHEKECNGLDPQTCVLLTTSVLNQVWNNTDPEDQNSIKKTIQSFQQEIQKTFKEELEEIRKEFQRLENEYFLPPKLIYENHFKQVENDRDEEIKRLGQYLEIKVAQKGGDKREDAISAIHKCCEEKRNAIMIGESGSGKTFMFLKMFKELADKFTRAEILSSSDEIPLFIELYGFSPPHIDKDLQDFLQKRLHIDGTRFLKDKEKYILFLDGLNESPNPAEAFKAIRGASDLRIFLSTQREEADFQRGFSIYNALPLGEEEVIKYLSYCPRIKEEAKDPKDLYQKLAKDIQREIKNPFFLFIFSTLYNETGNVPTSIGTLLFFFVDFVCDKKLTEDGVREPLDTTYKEKVLPYLAFSMCKENKRELKEGELEKLFKDVIPNAPHDYDKFKKQVCQRYWLIKKKKEIPQTDVGPLTRRITRSATVASFEFTHELFRDYFAAAYIKDKGMAIDEVMSLVFKNGKSNPTFVSVVQLLCGIESEERVGQLITDILKQDPFIAASCFALSTITDHLLFHIIHNAIDINNPNYLYLDRLPQFYQRGLELLEKLEKRGQPEYGEYQNSLGTAYWKLSEVRDKGTNLKQAINAFNEALKVSTFEQFPQHYAEVQDNLGIAYSCLSEVRDKEANLDRAINAYGQAINAFGEALRVGTVHENFLQSVARTLNNLGIAYRRLSNVKDTKANLECAINAYEKAIYAFKEAQRIGTFDSGFSQSYAMVQNNLGAVYMDLSEVGDKEVNLRQAIDAYNEALMVCNIEKFPWHYAQAQCNLGSIYHLLAEVRDKETNLRQAIDAHNEALRVYNFEKFPQNYAQTQWGLGNAYCKLSDVRDREENLGLAINAYKEVLKVCTKDALTWYFIETSYNMVLALRLRGDVSEALRVMEEMLPMAEEVKHPKAEAYRQFYEELKSSG